MWEVRCVAAPGLAIVASYCHGSDNRPRAEALAALTSVHIP